MDLTVGRLAPSPTGILHLGNARTFLWAWLAARSAGGRVILRIEDLEKSAQGTVLQQLLSDLKWLGLDWDEGPEWGPDQERQYRETNGKQPLAEDLQQRGDQGPYVQRQRGPYYQALFDDFLRRGLIYPCVCARSEYAHLQTAPHEGDAEPRYPGTCRGRFADWQEAQDYLNAKNPHEKGTVLRQPVWRFIVPDREVSFEDIVYGRQSLNVQVAVGDFVVFKSPTMPTYQLAVCADDASMGVNLVVRGDDLLLSSPRQILLLESMGQPIPRYAHAPLVVGPDGTRLAKRHGDARLQSARARGLDPRALVAQLARWSGFDISAPCAPSDLIPLWDWTRVSTRRVVLDEATLKRLDGNI